MAGTHWAQHGRNGRKAPHLSIRSQGRLSSLGDLFSLLQSNVRCYTSVKKTATGRISWELSGPKQHSVTTHHRHLTEPKYRCLLFLFLFTVWDKVWGFFFCFFVFFFFFLSWQLGGSYWKPGAIQDWHMPQTCGWRLLGPKGLKTRKEQGWGQRVWAVLLVFGTRKTKPDVTGSTFLLPLTSFLKMSIPQ